MTKVSIITATYNSESNIKSCLESLIKQSYSNFECLVIDGRSSDDTISIVNYYSKNYPFIKLISEKDTGIYDALNKGVNLANGDIIGFLHSDDFFANSEVISDIVDVFENKDVDGVYGDLDYVSQEISKKIIRKWRSRPFDKSILRKGWMPAHPTLFLKQDVYRKHGLFDLQFSIAADYDFLLRIFSDNSLKFAYFPIVIYKMQMGGASNRSLSNVFQKSKEDYRAIRKNGIGGFKTLLMKNLSKFRQFI